MKENVLAVIPAFKPSSALDKQVVALLLEVCDQVLVVDDGSGLDYRTSFDEVAQRLGCRVLRHEVNQGKGRALKTAFDYVLREMPEVKIVVTVDADGQHAPEDCKLVVAQLAASGADFCLGERSFSLHTTPFRSWWGNRWTSLAFLLRRGRWFADTQTGLRAFRRSLLPLLATIPGEGYEYEMAALCALVQRRSAIATQPIRTIYEEGNTSSHYDPLRDTIRVLRVLFTHKSV